MRIATVTLSDKGRSFMAASCSPNQFPDQDRNIPAKASKNRRW
jgi:hypothetical protein